MTLKQTCARRRAEAARDRAAHEAAYRQDLPRRLLWLMAEAGPFGSATVKVNFDDGLPRVEFCFYGSSLDNRTLNLQSEEYEVEMVESTVRGLQAELAERQRLQDVANAGRAKLTTAELAALREVGL